VDSSGFLIDPNTGYRVQRTGTTGEPTATSSGFQVSGDNNIKVPFGASLPGTTTANMTFQGNLSTTMNVGDSKTTALQVYDSQDTPRTLSVTFTKTGVNTFDATATIDGGGTATVTGGPITFDTSGDLVSPGTLSVSVSGLSGTAAQTISLNLGTPGETDGLTQLGGGSTASAVTQDGTGAGTLNNVSIDQNGIIQGLFSNGSTVPLAQLAIAGFDNETGLIRSGNNYYTTSPASGGAIIGSAGSGGNGAIQGGALEGSNVDIATEFARLIIAQRGYQANAETITAANTVLEQLGNIIH
jgi:flagellar hook protein FlgE